MPQLHINLDEQFSVLENCINRVRYFTKIAEYSFCVFDNSPDMWPSSIHGMKGEIKKPQGDAAIELHYNFMEWTKNSLLKDCFSNLYYVLIKSHEIMTLINSVENGVISKDISPEVSKFDTLPIDKKIAYLKEIGIEVDPKHHQHLFKGLKDIRDCLEHKAGFVTPSFGQKGKNGTRCVTWLEFIQYAIDSAGKKFKPKNGYIDLKGANRTHGVNLTLEVVKKSKKFQINQQISFSSDEVLSIAFTTRNMGVEIFNQVRNYAILKGFHEKAAA